MRGEPVPLAVILDEAQEGEHFGSRSEFSRSRHLNIYFRAANYADRNANK